MTVGESVVATSAVVPVLASGSLRAEQVTQLVLGESAAVLERKGDWRRIRTHLDDYEGWVHHGYVRDLAGADASEWRAAATAWSEGARVSIGGDVVVLPLRARVGLEDGLVTLPDGRAGRVVEGRVSEGAELAASARRMPVERWALEHFRGSPYQWGGLTPWGVDCSGLVQTAFAARGTVLPRDSSKQTGVGAEVPLDAIASGDILFFREENGPKITHVAFAGSGNTLIHSTVARGGVLEEPFTPGSRAGDALQTRLVIARRVAE